MRTILSVVILMAAPAVFSGQVTCPPQAGSSQYVASFELVENTRKITGELKVLIGDGSKTFPLHCEAGFHCAHEDDHSDRLCYNCDGVGDQDPYWFLANLYRGDSSELYSRITRIRDDMWDSEVTLSCVSSSTLPSGKTLDER